MNTKTEGLSETNAYREMHDAAIAAYEAAVPADYRYSATALRRAVDAAIAYRTLPVTDEGVVTEEMVKAALNASPYTSAVAVRHFLDARKEDKETIMRAALTAALTVGHKEIGIAPLRGAERSSEEGTT